MRNDSFVWLNAFHINAMLLLSDSDTPPHPAVPILFSLSWSYTCTQVRFLWLTCLPLDNINRLSLQFLEGRYMFLMVHGENVLHVLLVKWPRSSVSSGVSSSSMLTSRSSPVSRPSSSVSRASSDRTDPSLCSNDTSTGGEIHFLFWWDPAGQSAEEGFYLSACRTVGTVCSSCHPIRGQTFLDSFLSFLYTFMAKRI